MTSLFNRLTGKAVSRTAFVEHLGQEVVQHHPNWKVMISTDHKLMRIDTGHQTVEITLDDAYKRYQAAPDPLQEVAKARDWVLERMARAGLMGGENAAA